MMPPGRPKKDVESRKGTIKMLFDDGEEYQDILDCLRNEHDLKVSLYVLKKHLRAWGMRRYHEPSCNNERLRDYLILVLYTHNNAK